MKTKFPKSVSFNLKNEDDKTILKHVARRNFSGYVKRLILEDIKNKQEKKRQEPKPEEKQVDTSKSKSFRSQNRQNHPSVQGHNRGGGSQSVSQVKLNLPKP